MPEEREKNNCPKETDPLISVIVIFYNGESYLGACLESLINQNYENIEIICADDCSTDNSVAIAREYALKDKRVKVLEKCTKKGGQKQLGVVRNAGVAHAKGKYISFVDGDDTVNPEIYSVLAEKIKESNSDIYMFDHYVVENGIKHKSAPVYFEEKIFTGNDIRKIGFAGTVWCMLYKNEFLRKHNIEHFPVYMHEDIYFNMLCMCYVEKLHVLKDCYLYNYVQRKDSIVHTTNDKAKCSVKDIIYLKEYMIKNNKYEKFKEEYEKLKEPLLIHSYNRTPEEQKKEFLEEAKSAFTRNEYKRFVRHALKKRSIIENIFSIVNESNEAGDNKKKIITVLGKRFIINKSKTK